ncbi:MAG: FAD-dependent oxidoreductase [Actinomycetota bacterium]|nr:FAD-dependent oxidoreductase [Actinomycetota bacterium]
MILVVGAGVMGLATAYALARGGHDVRVVEQFGLDHRRGSSYGASRIFRLSYAEPEWVRLAQESLAAWRALERETGETLLELTGLLEPDDGSRAALEACGVAFESLSADEVARRFRLAVQRPCIFQPDAGIVYAERARHAFFSAGFRVDDDTRLASLAEVDADVIVVTAGSWAKPLLAAAGISLPVVATRETVAYFALAADGPVPSLIDEAAAPAGQAYYALAAPGVGVKAGLHRSGRPVDPDHDGAPDAEVVQRVSEWVREHFPVADAAPVHVETCLYTNAPNERFILERHGRIVVGSPCSGHGFKFAPVIGERLAALALSAAAERPSVG